MTFGMLPFLVQQCRVSMGGNLSTGYSIQNIVGTFSMYFLFNYKPQVWRKYNYLTAAAFDTGYNLAVLLIFIIFSSGKTISMPN